MAAVFLLGDIQIFKCRVLADGLNLPISSGARA